MSGGMMVIKFLFISIVTAAISYLITHSEIMASFQTWINKKDKLPMKLYILLTCGYCLGHWIAVPLVFLYRLRVVNCWLPLDLILTVLAVAFVSGMLYFLMIYLMKITDGGEG